MFYRKIGKKYHQWKEASGKTKTNSNLKHTHTQKPKPPQQNQNAKTKKTKQNPLRCSTNNSQAHILRRHKADLGA